MDVIRHDDKGMYNVMSEAFSIVVNCLNHHFGHLRLAKVERASARLVEETIQSGKHFSGWQSAAREPTTRRETAMESPSEEDGLLGGADMR